MLLAGVMILEFLTPEGSLQSKGCLAHLSVRPRMSLIPLGTKASGSLWKLGIKSFCKSQSSAPTVCPHKRSILCPPAASWLSAVCPSLSAANGRSLSTGAAAPHCADSIWGRHIWLELEVLW